MAIVVDTENYIKTLFKPKHYESKPITNQTTTFPVPVEQA